MQAVDSITQREPYHLSPPRIERQPDGTWQVHGYAEARQILTGDVNQAGFQAEVSSKVPGMRIKPVLWNDGEEHRTQRRQIARYFSPATVQNRYKELIEQYADEVLADFRRAGRADLHDLSARIAVSVAGDVVGLTESKRSALYHRLDALLHSTPHPGRGLRATWSNWMTQKDVLWFYWKDVRPAIAARKRAPQEDVISQMLANDRSVPEIMAECITYGAAGMVTTQEFIAVAALHLLKKPQLKERFLQAEQEERYKILHELLRLEPVVGRLYRRSNIYLTVETEGKTVTIPPNALIELFIYDINADARAAGERPLEIDPDREVEKRASPSIMSFGSGPHRCAGEHIAIAETDVFLRKLLVLPGLKIEREPDFGYFETAKGYEVRNFILSVSKA